MLKLIKKFIHASIVCVFRENMCSIIMFQATNEVITRVPEATQEEMNRAVESAQKAFKSWSNTTVLHRQQIMFKYQQLIKDNMVSCVC